MSAGRGVVAWCGPAALALVAARVFAGDPLAPFVALLVAVGPLVALVHARDTSPSTAAHAALALPGLAGLVIAHAAVVADFARHDALPPWLAAVLVLALALAALSPASSSAWRLVAGVGVTAFVIPVIVAGAVTLTSPWSAWSQVASRSTLVFADRSPWVTEGRTMPRAATFAFDEPHRVTAVTAGTWHVTEREGARVTLRERRLAAGDSVVLRPGDRLSVDAGTRLQFERGKRVPGAVPSGVAWADPPERGSAATALATLGALVTLGAGALAIVPPSRAAARTRAVLPALLAPAVALAAVSGGIYAMYGAPDIALGATLTAALHDLPRSALGPVAAALMMALLGVAFLALFAASAWSLAARARETLTAVAPRRGAPLWTASWVAASLAASAAAHWLIDPERVLLLSLGALASTWTAPSLASAPPRATAIAAAVGAVLFAILAVLLPAPALPALLSAPAAWGTAKFLDRSREDEVD